MPTTLKAQLGAAALATAFVTGATVATHAVAAGAPPSVLAFDQKVQGNEVSLDYVGLPTDGYVVIYGTDKDGKPMKEPLGHAELKAGDHRAIKVKLGSTPQSGSALWVSLYSDKDGKPGFNKGGDAPIWSEGPPLVNRFIVK